MQLKEFDILLDIRKHNKSEYFEVVQGDLNSNILNISLVDDLKPYDLTGTNVEIVYSKSDGTVVLQDDVVILEALQGELKCMLKSNTIAAQGRVRAEVRVLEGEALLTSTRFEFFVRKSLLTDDAVESTNEFPILKQLTNDVQGVIATETDRVHAEDIRVSNEVDRVDNENNRVQAEQDRTVTFEGYETRVSTVESDLSTHKEDYANLEGMVTNVIDGDITNVLNNQLVATDIANKLIAKEVEYAPRLNDLTAQLAQNENRIDLVSDFNRIGKIKLPDDFPKTLPFELYRDNDGIVKHTMNLDEFEIGAGHIHIKAYQTSSADSNDGLTEDTAVRLVNEAITKANALPQSTVVIHFYDDSIDVSRFAGVPTYTLAKNLVLKSHAPSGRTAFFTGYRMNTETWTPEGNTYTTPAVPYSRDIAYDGKFKDYRDTPRKMKVVSSVAEVDSTPNSIYYGADKTYIHTLDSREPDGSIMLLQDNSKQLIFNTNGKRLVIRDCHFVWYGGGNSLRVNGLGTNANDRSEFWYENCVFTQAKTNGLQVVGVYETYGFNSTAYDVPSDGFNYHALSMSDAGSEFVFEYQCEGFDCGNAGDSTMNATTAHEGMTVLRVGSVGYRTYGPVCADVNGCFSVNIDCNMYDSLRPTFRTRAGFYFDKSGEKVGLGKAYLLNCSGGGKDTWTFNSDGNVEITIQKITGNNIPTNIPYTVV